jgi:hypothetical protein
MIMMLNTKDLFVNEADMSSLFPACRLVFDIHWRHVNYIIKSQVGYLVLEQEGIFGEFTTQEVGRNRLSLSHTCKIH